jgi:hypothetical protein
MAEKKICRLCGASKPITAFSRRGNGYLTKCKDCHNSYMLSWRRKNPNGVGEFAREKRRYAVQKGDAKRRGIAFLLTFEEWLGIWQESGHINESGSFAGQYCMARYGDKGPYAVGNIRICTIEENHRELRHSDDHKAGMFGNDYAKGLKHTKKTKKRISNSLRLFHAQKRRLFNGGDGQVSG